MSSQATFVPANPEPAQSGVQYIRSAWCLSSTKRLVDVIGAFLLLLLSAPLILLIAVLIKLTSQGPVFFLQHRVGRLNSSFVIIKFRTMRHDAASSGPSVSLWNDGRQTLVGRILRPVKLDELPQLWNVIRGDMSLVGPRPRIAHHQPITLHCKPGLTSPASLIFCRENELVRLLDVNAHADIASGYFKTEKADLDSRYMHESSFQYDIKILCQSAAVCIPGLAGRVADKALRDYGTSLLTQHTSLSQSFSQQ